MTPARPSAIIVEDHPLVAQGLRSLLQATIDVLDIVSHADALPDALVRNRPDLVLLDLAMPDRNGLELLPVIRETLADARILIVTMHLDRVLADLALELGAHGFVPKEATAEELREAIEVVLDGRTFVSPRVPARRSHGDRMGAPPILDQLTPRQRDILRLTVLGRTAAEIGAELHLSPRTVEYHRRSVRRILGVSSEAALVRYVLAAGYDPDGDRA